MVLPLRCMTQDRAYNIRPAFHFVQYTPQPLKIYNILFWFNCKKIKLAWKVHALFA